MKKFLLGSAILLGLLSYPAYTIAPLQLKTTLASYVFGFLQVPHNQAVQNKAFTVKLETGHQNRLNNGSFDALNSLSGWDEATVGGWVKDESRCLDGSCLTLNTTAIADAGELRQTINFANHEQGLRVLFSVYVYRGLTDEGAYELCLDNTCRPIDHTGYKLLGVQGFSAATNVIYIRPIGGSFTDGTQVDISLDVAKFEPTLKIVNMTADEVGSIKAWPAAVLPSTDYSIADGECLSKTEYTSLFAVIGTKYGECDSGAGAGSGFNEPDYRGKFLRGYDPTLTIDVDGASRTACSAGGDSGNLVGTCQLDAMQRITGEMYNNFYGNTSNRFGNSPNETYGVFSATNAGRGAYEVTGATNGYGSSVSGTLFDSADSVSPNAAKTSDTETRPINVTVNWIIKRQGLSSASIITQDSYSPLKAGFIEIAAFNKNIAGKLPADGRCVLKSRYPDYVKNVGTIYGECTINTTNDGVNLPDARGYFFRVLDDMGTSAGAAGVDLDGTARTVGQTQDDEIESHTHTYTAEQFGGGGTHDAPQYVAAGFNAGTFTTESVSTVGGTETRSKNIAIMAYVRMVDADVLYGVFTQDHMEDKYSEAERTYGTWNGEQLYRRCFTVDAEITSLNANYINWGAGLKPKNTTQYFTNFWLIAGTSDGGTGTNYYRIFYNSSTGYVGVDMTGTFTIGEGTSYCMDYTK